MMYTIICVWVCVQVWMWKVSIECLARRWTSSDSSASLTQVGELHTVSPTARGCHTHVLTTTLNLVCYYVVVVVIAIAIVVVVVVVVDDDE